MYARDYRKLAWGKLQGKWGLPILAAVIVTVVTGFLSGTFIGMLLLTGFVMVGSVSFFMNIVEKDEVKLDSLLDGLHGNLGNTLMTGLLYNVYLMLWTMLFFIPGLIKSYSYAMTFYILRDNPEMSANEAITKSREMMNGNKWRLFCLHFSFFGWVLLGTITCGIAMLWVVPYMETATAAFYQSLKGAPVEVEAEVSSEAEADTEAAEQ